MEVGSGARMPGVVVPCRASVGTQVPTGRQDLEVQLPLGETDACSPLAVTPLSSGGRVPTIFPQVANLGVKLLESGNWRCCPQDDLN
jgi:hypothetical protein